ncbi:MAG: hypothetical protein ABIS50_17490 [Luteolibacter sp.]|uniref:hypothetical protein n=1 Tax=Luteolibacter sp. TaxID=1962973 RepID=UPI0032676446
MNDILSVFVALAVMAIIVLVFTWHFSRSRSVLEQWAIENGYTIIHSEYRHFMRGPFFWTTSKGQTVYQVSVRDKAGTVRSGWVRCGGFFLGLLSDNAEVRWEN